MLKQKLAQLINVKTIVTFVVAAVFAVLALRENLGENTEALVVITTVFGFYFGTQKQKQDDSNT